MSEPRTDYPNRLEGARAELTSAISALNMLPLPVLSSPSYERDFAFLRQSDVWVRHAIEHIVAAFQLVVPFHDILGVDGEEGEREG